MTAQFAQFFAPVSRNLAPSGRASEFRMHEGRLEQLGPDNQWRRYVPFRDLQQMLGRPWRQEEARQRPATAGNGRQPAPVPVEDAPRLKDTQEMPAVQLPAPPATEGGHMDMQVRAADRLAQISKRQMARAQAAPAPVQESAMHAETTEGKNGVGNHERGKHYPRAFKGDIVRRFADADDKAAFAESLGLAAAMLHRWSREARSGKSWAGSPGSAAPLPVKPDSTRPAPVKPAAPRTARAQPPAVDRDFTTELDVLRQLLELPADARERIVAYLTSRGR